MLILMSLFATRPGRFNAYSIVFASLRHWYLRSNRCLIAHSTWEEVTITNCNLVRCTFRNTSFCNLQFRNCTFVDVDFEAVTMRNILVADTTLSHTSITASALDSGSWSHNTFDDSIVYNVESTLSNWTYITYSGIVIKDLIETQASVSMIGRPNLGVIPTIV